MPFKLISPNVKLWYAVALHLNDSLQDLKPIKIKSKLEHFEKMNGKIRIWKMEHVRRAPHLRSETYANLFVVCIALRQSNGTRFPNSLWCGCMEVFLWRVRDKKKTNWRANSCDTRTGSERVKFQICMWWKPVASVELHVTEQICSAILSVFKMSITFSNLVIRKLSYTIDRVWVHTHNMTCQ